MNAHDAYMPTSFGFSFVTKLDDGALAEVLCTSHPHGPEVDSVWKIVALNELPLCDRELIDREMREEAREASGREGL